MHNLKPLIITGMALLILTAVLAGCTSAAARTKNNEKPRSLTLFAFNYTDRSILNITVNGMWMGKASAYTNGGTAMGPRPPRDRTKQHTIEVRWELSDRFDLKTNKYVALGPLEPRHATVPIKMPYPENPNELILHFYQDGRVEAEMIDRKDNAFDFRRVPIPEGHRDHGRS